MQMACTHTAALSVLGTFPGASLIGSAKLRRLRNGGSQVVRVEHVHLNEGGQAAIGNGNSIPGSAR